MDFERLRRCLLSKPGAYEDWPFGPVVLVFKVCGRMFAMVPVKDGPRHITLKSDPDLSLHLRSMFEDIKPAFYMNKKHWNSVLLDGDVPDGLIEEMIDDSYRLVVTKLKKADREKLLEDTR